VTRLPIIVVVVVAGLAAACSNRPSTSICEKTIDHMIDIFVAPVVKPGGSPTTEQSKDAEAWKKALKEKDPLKAVLMKTCRTKMTDAVTSCVLAAQDEVTLTACFTD
jgi:hypothetical protein